MVSGSVTVWMVALPGIPLVNSAQLVFSRLSTHSMPYSPFVRVMKDRSHPQGVPDTVDLVSDFAGDHVLRLLVEFAAKGVRFGAKRLAMGDS